MLSRAVTKNTKLTRNFAIFNRITSKLFNFPNKSDPLYKIAHGSLNAPFEGYYSNASQMNEHQAQVTVLENGITVFSETPDVPGTVGVQCLLNIGTRDEDTKTSGALLNIKNTYYKTVRNTNEAVNYGMVQMTGGEFTMNYNQDTTLFKASCLAHDVYDITQMVHDCAVEPRSVVAANVGISKNKNTHALEQNLNSGFDLNDTLFRIAYGLQGLGMPLLGLQSNIEYLNASTLQHFQRKTIRPNRIIFGGSNVENHGEFVDIVSEITAAIPAEGNTGEFARTSSGYVGGEYKAGNDTNRIDVVIAYQTEGWSKETSTALALAASIFGHHSSSSVNNATFAPAHRAYQQLVSQHSFIDDASAIDFNFAGSGLFGVRLGGQAAQAQEIFDHANSQLTSLAENITEAELQAAKNTLKVKLLRGLEKPNDRLTESLQNLAIYGDVVHGEYLNWIDSATVAQVQNAVANILHGTPTIIVNGGHAPSVNTSI